MLYRIPILYCPFIASIHPQAAEIEEHTLQWLLDFRLVDNHPTFLRYKANRFPLFIARTFPEGELTDVCTWCDLNSLLFIVDDSFDEKDVIKDRPSFDHFRRKFMNVLNDRTAAPASDQEEPVFAALGDIWGRLRIRSNVAWQRKFIGCIGQMFDGLYWQFNNTMLGMHPKFDDYLKIRQFLGASHLSTDSLEVTGKIFLPEHVYRHPLVARLTELSRNCVCFANDLFSLGKETRESQNAGEYNLVGVMRRKANLSMEEAIKATADYHDALVREFIFLSEKVFLFDDRTNRMLEKYAGALKTQMIANIVWSTTETDRYPHLYGEAEQSSLNTKTMQ